MASGSSAVLIAEPWGRCPSPRVLTGTCTARRSAPPTGRHLALCPAGGEDNAHGPRSIGPPRSPVREGLGPAVVFARAQSNVRAPLPPGGKTRHSPRPCTPVASASVCVCRAGFRTSSFAAGPLVRPRSPATPQRYLSIPLRTTPKSAPRVQCVYMCVRVCECVSV